MSKGVVRRILFFPCISDRSFESALYVRSWTFFQPHKTFFQLGCNSTTDLHEYFNMYALWGPEATFLVFGLTTKCREDDLRSIYKTYYEAKENIMPKKYYNDKR